MLLRALDPGGGRPDRPDAVRVGSAAASWEAVAGAAAAVAAEVAGAPAVAVYAAADLRTVVAVAGCLAAGVPAVPVPADVGVREQRHILTDSGAAFVLGGPGAAGPGCPPALPVDLRRRAPRRSGPEPPPDATALILYTSGTTGPPKGVRLSRRAVAANLDALADAWAWTPDDTLVHGLPLFHVHGLILGVLGALRVGSGLVHTGRPTPAAYAAAGGTLYFGVPTVWSRVAADEAAARALGPARLLVSGSAALPVPVSERLAALAGQAPVERYGMTETLITVAVRADREPRPGWVGLPVAGVRTRLTDERGDPAPADGHTIGGLEVRGDSLFDGYLGQPRATAAAYTADGWFRTGDAAVLGPDGYHRIVGRQSSDLISSGGFRIGAAEVEAALLAHPGVREAAVVGAPDPDLGQRVVAYVVADGVDAAGLSDFVAGQLSVHKRPRQVRFVSELPRNAMGKVLKTRLAES